MSREMVALSPIIGYSGDMVERRKSKHREPHVCRHCLYRWLGKAHPQRCPNCGTRDWALVERRPPGRPRHANNSNCS